jgi:hypothetical protein
MNYSSFLTYHLVCYKNNTTNTTGGAGTAYLSGTPKVHPRDISGCQDKYDTRAYINRNHISFSIEMLSLWPEAFQNQSLKR